MGEKREFEFFWVTKIYSCLYKNRKEETMRASKSRIKINNKIEANRRPCPALTTNEECDEIVAEASPLAVC